MARKRALKRRADYRSGGVVSRKRLYYGGGSYDHDEGEMGTSGLDDLDPDWSPGPVGETAAERTARLAEKEKKRLAAIEAEKQKQRDRYQAMTSEEGGTTVEVDRAVDPDTGAVKLKAEGQTKVDDPEVDKIIS